MFAVRKEEKYQIRGNTVFMLILILSIVSIILSIPAQAASSKQKAINAYRKMLSKNRIEIYQKGKLMVTNGDTCANNKTKTKADQVEFALALIDDDSVPELILRAEHKEKNEYGIYTIFGIYTWKNGKICRVSYKSLSWKSPIVYYKKSGLYRVTEPVGIDSEESYYRLSGKKAYLEYVHNISGEPGVPDRYYIAEKNSYNYDKNISKSRFKRLLKKACGGKKARKVVFRKNTKANRKKYLK